VAARFVVHEVAADVVARVDRAMPALSSAVDLEVERLWQAARQRVAAGGAGRLFNGRVFSADIITTGTNIFATSCGKHVHANMFGDGGDVSAIQVV